MLALVHGQCTNTQRELQALGSRNCFLYFVLEWGALHTPYPLLLSFYLYRLLLEKGLHRSLHMKPGKVCLITYVNRRLQLQTLGRCLASYLGSMEKEILRTRGSYHLFCRKTSVFFNQRLQSQLMVCDIQFQSAKLCQALYHVSSVHLLFYF